MVMNLASNELLEQFFSKADQLIELTKRNIRTPKKLNKAALSRGHAKNALARKNQAAPMSMKKTSRHKKKKMARVQTFEIISQLQDSIQALLNQIEIKAPIQIFEILRRYPAASFTGLLLRALERIDRGYFNEQQLSILRVLYQKIRWSSGNAHVQRACNLILRFGQAGIACVEKLVDENISQCKKRILLKAILRAVKPFSEFSQACGNIAKQICADIQNKASTRTYALEIVSRFCFEQSSPSIFIREILTRKTKSQNIRISHAALCDYRRCKPASVLLLQTFSESRVQFEKRRLSKAMSKVGNSLHSAKISDADCIVFENAHVLERTLGMIFAGKAYTPFGKNLLIELCTYGKELSPRGKFGFTTCVRFSLSS